MNALLEKIQQPSPGSLLARSVGPVRCLVIVAAVLSLLLTLILWSGMGRMKVDPFCAWACVLAMVWIVLRRICGANNRPERALFASALFVLFLVVVLHLNFKQTVGLYKKGDIRAWNMYHYYLGSKYFDELGYKDLYLQTILADREDTGRLKSITRVRDMSDYATKRVDKILPAERNAAWTDGRWAEFKSDLRVFLRQMGKRTWSRVLRDRGYNPTPFWNTVGSFISHRLDIQNRGELLFATSIDFILYAAMIGCMIWAFGIEAALLGFLVFVLLPFSIGRLVAGYIQYDWLAAMVVGVCMVKKKRPIGAAVAFGYGTLARAFPLVLAAGLGAPALKKLILTKKLERFYLWFAAAFLVVCILGLILGSLSSHGPNTWKMWQENIKTHNHHMIFGEGRVGLKHIFIHKLGEKHRFENTREREKMLPRQIHYYYMSAALFFLLFLPSFWFLKDVNATIFSMILVFILLVPSHYYWSMLMVLPLWSDEEDRPWSPALIPSLTAFLVPCGWFFYAQGQQNPLARYIRFDWILAFCFLALMASVLLPGIVRMIRERQSAAQAREAT